jgi:serine/threonine-protein kinase RsbW
VGGDLAGALDFELAAVPETVTVARDRVAAWTEQHDPSEQHLYAIKTGVSEAVGNAVTHAYRDRPDDPGRVRVQAQVYDSSIMLCVADLGMGMGPRADSPGLGMGLPLIAHLSDGFEIVCMPAREAGTEIRMTFRLGGDGAVQRHLVDQGGRS